MKSVFEKFATEEIKCYKKLGIKNITQLPLNVFSEIIKYHEKKNTIYYDDASSRHELHINNQYHEIIHLETNLLLDVFAPLRKQKVLKKFVRVVLRKVRQNLDTASITKKAEQ